MKIEILPLPKNNGQGFAVLFDGFTENEVGKIKNILMAMLIEEKYLPKPTDIKKREKEVIFFEVIAETLTMKSLFDFVNRASSIISCFQKKER